MKGMVAEKLLPYPCLMWEEGTEDEKPLIYPCRGQLAYKMSEVSDL